MKPDKIVIHPNDQSPLWPWYTALRLMPRRFINAHTIRALTSPECRAPNVEGRVAPYLYMARLAYLHSKSSGYIDLREPRS
jgi:hypothetical protein